MTRLTFTDYTSTSPRGIDSIPIFSFSASRNIIIVYIINVRTHPERWKTGESSSESLVWWDLTTKYRSTRSPSESLLIGTQFQSEMSYETITYSVLVLNWTYNWACPVSNTRITRTSSLNCFDLRWQSWSCFE